MHVADVLMCSTVSAGRRRHARHGDLTEAYQAVPWEAEVSAAAFAKQPMRVLYCLQIVQARLVPTHPVN